MAVGIKTDVVLNGGSVDITVLEDTTGDGVADNSETISVADGVSDYVLETLTGGTGNDYWLDVSVSSTSVTSTPVVQDVAIETEVQGELTTDVALNGGSVDITVLEDTTGDGNPDNSEKISVADGVNTYDIFTVSGESGNDVWLDIDVTASGITSTPVVNSAALAIGSEAFGGQVAASTTPQGAEVLERVSAGDVSIATSPQGATVPTGSSLGGGQVAATAVPQAAETPEGVSAGGVLATATPDGSLLKGEISGTVTKNGSAVQGAKLFVLDSENDELLATASTGSDGNYSVLVESEQVVHVAVQYEDADGKYNDESKPFVVV